MDKNVRCESNLQLSASIRCDPVAPDVGHFVFAVSRQF